MKTYYADILEGIPAPPTWWDENGVPRYCEFHPSKKADIYSGECALIEVACQCCDARFHVAQSSGLPELHYGDPPNRYCCEAGPSMTSIPVSVIEYWEFSNSGFEWKLVEDPQVELPEYAREDL